MKDVLRDPSLVLYLPLYKKDGASFMSEDAYGHLCTVTGATWGIQGRHFNATSDKIVAGNILDSVWTAGNFTISGWVNIKAGAGTRHIIGKYTTAGGKREFYLHANTPDENDMTFRVAEDGAGSVTRDFIVDEGILTRSWQFFSWAVNVGGDTATCRVNGVNKTVAKSGGGAVTDISATAAVLEIGAYNAGTDNWFGDYIGELWVHNKLLSIPESDNLYLSTRWRYL